jgi:hypothetical protein
MALHSSSQIFIDDRCVFSRKRFALVDDLASVDTVIQHEVKRATRKPLAAMGLPTAAMRRLLTTPAAARSSRKALTVPSST